MKQIIATAFFSILLSFCTAQEIYVGYRLGLSYTGTKFEATNMYNGSQYHGTNISKFSIFSGLTGNFEFAKNISLQTEVLIQNKGYSNIFDLADKSYVNLWHLNFPQYLRYSQQVHKKSKNTFFAEGGPYFAWLFKSTYVIKDSGETTKTDIKGAYTFAEYGLGTGCGFRHSTGSGFLEYNLRYEFSIGNVLQNTNISPSFSDNATAEYYRILTLSCNYSYSINDIAEKLFTGK